MAGSLAPVMYCAVRSTLCKRLAVRGRAVAIPCGNATSQDALNSAAAELFENLRTHAKSFQSPEAMSWFSHNSVKRSSCSLFSNDCMLANRTDGGGGLPTRRQILTRHPDLRPLYRCLFIMRMTGIWAWAGI